MAFQTMQKDDYNRYKNSSEELKNELCSIWLGIMYTDRTFFEKPINEATIRQIRQILDEEA